MMTPEERRSHLTPELRAHFENIGVTLVSHDVSNHNYSANEKHNAALAWLKEKREAHEATEARRFKIMVGLTALGVALAGLAAWFAYLSVPR